MKQAFVTGGHGTIGGAICKHLGNRGYEVTAPKSGEMLVQSPDMVSAYMRKLSEINVLVACHGMIGEVGPAVGCEYWEHAIMVNLVGTMNVIKNAMPHLSKGSHIIIIAGGGGMLDPMPMMAAYGCSKAGLVSLTKSLAVELDGIPVNAIFPGMQDSRIHDVVVFAAEKGGIQWEKVKSLKANGHGAVPVERTLAAIDYILAGYETGKIIFSRTMEQK